MHATVSRFGIRAKQKCRTEGASRKDAKAQRILLTESRKGDLARRAGILALDSFASLRLCVMSSRCVACRQHSVTDCQSCRNSDAFRYVRARYSYPCHANVSAATTRQYQTNQLKPRWLMIRSSHRRATRPTTNDVAAPITSTSGLYPPSIP